MPDSLPFPALRRKDLHPNPVEQFRAWFDAAAQAGLPEPNAMTLSTATKDGIPSARIVLLKEFGEGGFVFFTNYASQKGREMAENPRACLVFHWALLQRQVRITGSVTKTSLEESESYFYSRPLGSQLGAWASPQSAIIKDRAELENRLRAVTEKFAGQTIPLPLSWGGFRLAPTQIEFWQAGGFRLHDRFLYRRSPAGEWRIARLSP